MILNVIVMVCSFANPAQCEWLVSFTEPTEGITVAECRATALKQADDWAAVNAPGWIAVKSRCTFAETKGA